MSHSAFSSTVETALNQTIVARLLLEGCELLIGSEQGVVLLAIQLEARSFEPTLPPSLPSSEWEGCKATIEKVSAALRTQKSSEIYGTGKTAFLRSLAQQSDLLDCYPHGILYLNQSDPIEDLLQTVFEQFYHVPPDVKPSRAEIRSRLSDRQALILLDHPKLTESELVQIQQALPESTFAIASIDQRFPQVENVIELPDLISEPDITLTESEKVIVELLATVGISLSLEQIRAIVDVPNVQRLIELKLISVDQNRYSLQQSYQSSDQSMERVLMYVLKWVRSQPEAVVKERELLMTTLQWSADNKRWLEVIEIVRSIETDFAIAKLWGSWSKVLRWGLAAAWALQDEAIEAWALHQLGTLTFCQEEVTTGYDTLRDALAIETELGNQTAIAFSQHNLAQIRALIRPLA